jgi:predicted site-specific integrase-resolvase
LRRWEATGRLTPARTEGGQRRYDLAALRPGFAHDADVPRKTLAYARVSSHDQKADLESQRQVLERYCASQGWTFDIIADRGSGMNYHKRGLQRLLDEILAGAVGRLVLTHKDRLLRVGAELVFAICQAREIEVVIINQGQDTSFEEELSSDVLEIVTVFSARLYGSRSRKNQKLIDGVRNAVKDAQC